MTSGTLQEWLDAGYAVFSMSDRGWGNSCGGADPNRILPVCLNGYNHLMDTRYEVRDAQEVFAALADQPADGATAGEGLIAPQAIGVDGRLVRGRHLDGPRSAKPQSGGKCSRDGSNSSPWVSDGGKPMRIAAAQPDIPWTDLAYSLQPNGHTLDYVADAPYLQRGRIGVLKQSFVAGLYGLGLALSNYAAPGIDPDADLTVWYATINAGEPYDQNPLSQDIVDEIARHHSSYYIDDSTPPAPMLISNGWTDDLFPPDEAIRFYNRTRTSHPGTPIALMFTDHGHQRGQNKTADAAFRSRATHAWFDFYVKGTGPQPFLGVRTLTQACGGPSGGATGEFDDPDTDLPFQAASWAALAPGEVRVESAAPQMISSAVPTDAPVGQAFDPITGGGACATASGADQTGAATYRSDPAPSGGFTLMGSATIVADILSPGPTSQVAARLLDVDPVSGNADARRPWSLSTGDHADHRQLPGLPAPPERVAFRRRSRREARAASRRPAVWPELERPAADHGLQPPAPPAGPRAAGQWTDREPVPQSAAGGLHARRGRDRRRGRELPAGNHDHDHRPLHDHDDGVDHDYDDGPVARHAPPHARQGSCTEHCRKRQRQPRRPGRLRHPARLHRPAAVHRARAGWCDAGSPPHLRNLQHTGERPRHHLSRRGPGRRLQGPLQALTTESRGDQFQGELPATGDLGAFRGAGEDDARAQQRRRADGRNRELQRQNLGAQVQGVIRRGTVRG